MELNYQDNNLIVMYLQIFLQERMNTTVMKVVPRKKSEPSYYTISSNHPVRVTGYYTPQTYSALALYMAYNYPNEGFPQKWTKEYGESGTPVWRAEDYIFDGESTEELVKIISDNMENSVLYKSTIKVPERVLSYIFNEVVSPNSSPEEILRIKKMIYTIVHADINHLYPLTYDEDLTDKVIEIQSQYIADQGEDSSQEYRAELISDGESNKYFIKSNLKEVSVTAKGADITSKLHNTTSCYLTPPPISITKVVVDGQELVPGNDNSQGVFQYSKNNGYLKIHYDGELSSVKIDYSPDFHYNVVTGELRFNEIFSEDLVLEVLAKDVKYKTLPEQFDGFKITGYVDPWTELVMKKVIEGGIEDGDSNIRD